MKNKIKNRNIVIVNQAVNYLTIGICNEFSKKVKNVSLITGSIHSQGEELNEEVKVKYINKLEETHGVSKVFNYLIAITKIYFLLITKYRKHEVFFISVPPMAYLLNIILKNKFSMIIWDVYPDVFKITGMKESHILYKTWAKLNHYSFKKAFRIFTIGEKMAQLIANYVNREKLIIQPIWSIFQKNEKVEKADNPFVIQNKLSKKFIVQYSGNIGLTHNVESMIDIAKEMKEYSNILFQIIGRGPRKALLEERVKEEKLSNCQFLPFQSDEMFPFSLSAADLGVVILDELTSKGSVPSKSYNLMSYGIPSLYIASEDSELMNYANKFGHAKCFPKKEINNIVDFIVQLSNSKAFYNQLSINSLKAAENFKRVNASKFIDFYFNDTLNN